MRHCETCGCELRDDNPFAVCPKCLFRTALGAYGGSGAASPPHNEMGASPPGIATRLFPSRDFFQKYEILERVAEGGQGDIWKVWDIELRRCVAMKRLAVSALDSPAAVYRFLAEAQIASQLEHPGILPIFDIGIDPDHRPFYTTQLLPGTTIADVWRKIRDAQNEGWTVPRAMELLLRVCEIMAQAHSCGVIHRDLKPSNILVGPFGDVRVIDWGSAHVLEPARKDFKEPFVTLNRLAVETERGDAIWAEPGSPLMTANAGQPVTIAFMPPEVFSSRAEEAGPQMDIYSLGVILYELLTGRAPYSRDDGSLPERSELKGMILQGPPQPVRILKPSVSRDQAAICQKAMAYNKADRYATMEELASDIRLLLTARPVNARKPGLILKFQKWAQRHLSFLLLGGATLLVLSAAFFVTRGMQAQRDTARQVEALRNAELASRSGQWRQALRYWDDAERAGYRDPVYLGLKRAEAWTVLSQAAKAEKELRQLARRSDLGKQRGAVLLRLGEHELFNPATASEGVKHVRQALEAGLTGADEACAKGLLSESTTNALEWLRLALQRNPYYHAAHRHSMGLEFLLGRHQELKNHIELFTALYPDDPTSGYLEATELALQGHSAGAQVALARLRTRENEDTWQILNSSLRNLAAIVNDFDLDNLLSSGRMEAGKRKELMLGTSKMFLPGNVASPVKPVSGIRFPQLPCVQKGINEGFQAAGSLMIPYLSDPEAAILTIKTCWRNHPEAWLPFLAGLILDSRLSNRDGKALAQLSTQADLFQMAANSPAAIPRLPRLARFLAANAQFELANSNWTNAPVARRECLANLYRAARSDDTSAVECAAYFELAFRLQDCELARMLLAQWQRCQSNEPGIIRKRVELEIMSGSINTALHLIDQMLASAPDDPWAVAQRKAAIEKLQLILRSFPE